MVMVMMMLLLSLSSMCGRGDEKGRSTVELKKDRNKERITGNDCTAEVQTCSKGSPCKGGRNVHCLIVTMSVDDRNNCLHNRLHRSNTLSELVMALACTAKQSRVPYRC